MSTASPTTSSSSSSSSSSFTPYPYETRSEIVTSFIPITTAWSPPNAEQAFSCASAATWKNNDNLILYDVNLMVSGAVDLTCWPPGATLWWQQNEMGPAHTATVASLGPIVCPLAYSTIGSTVSGRSTFVACCPLDFEVKRTAFDREWDQCYSMVTSGAVVTYYTRSTTDGVLTWLSQSSTVEVAQTVYGLPFNGYNIDVETTTGNASTSCNDSSSSGGGLSSGAKVGIGVGVALGTIGLLAMIGALVILSRARKQQRNAPSSSQNMRASPGSGMANGGISTLPYHPVPGDPAHRHEIRGNRSPIEVQ